MYRDKYVRTLDSLAKLDYTLDYVCSNDIHKECNGSPWTMLLCSMVDERRVGVLNCPQHPSDKTKRRPVEGEVYATLLSGSGGFIEPYSFNTSIGEVISYPYTFRYGRDLTEAQILRHFNFKMMKGLYGKREFYHQVYDEETVNDGYFDTRNTLFWKPDIMTNEQGEATIDFFCSDINTRFLGIVEGTGGLGLLGNENFVFYVKNK